MKTKVKKLSALFLVLTMLVGLIPFGAFPAFAGVVYEDMSGKLGYGFNALKDGGVDPVELSSAFSSNRILNNDVEVKTTDEGKTTNNYISSDTIEEFKNTYTSSKKLSLNTNIPIKMVSFNLEAKFGQDITSVYESSKSNFLEIFYSENITKKAEIINLNGVEGAKRRLTQDFKDRLSAIKNETDKDKQNKLIDTLFEEFGTHAVTSVYLGGTLEITNYNHSDKENYTDTLKNESSLSATIGVGKFSIGTVYSDNSSNTTEIKQTNNNEIGRIVGHGATYGGTKKLTDAEFKAWQNDLRNTQSVFSFVDNRSLIPVWELTDDESLSETIYSYFLHKMIISSDVKLDSYIYYNGKTSASAVDSYLILPFGEVNEVAPGSTVYFSLPFDGVTVSLRTDSVYRANISDETYGKVDIKPNAEDGQTVTVDMKYKDEIIGSVVFTVKREGFYAGAEYFESGYGTAERPYLIANAAQLQNLKYFCASANEAEYRNIYYELASDIDLEGVEFEPIDTFYGNLNGNGHTIKNWTYERDQDYYNNKYNDWFSESVGLIREHRGNIKNLNFNKINIQLHCNESVPKIVMMFAGSLCGSCYGNIKNVYVSDSKIIGRSGYNNDVERQTYIGGVCGVVWAGDITKCGVSDSHVHAWSKINNNFSYTYAGAVIGKTANNNSSSCISDLFANNNVVFSDAHGGCNITWGIFGGYSGTVYVKASGIIGEVGNCRELIRLVSVKNSLCNEVNSNYDYYNSTNFGNWGVDESNNHHRWAGDSFCVYSNDGSKRAENTYVFDNLSAVQLDEQLKSNGWKKEEGLYFVKDKIEAPDSTVLPFIRNITESGVETLDLPIFEYRIDGEEWQGKVDFDGLEPNSTHYIYVRFAETGAKEASAQSNAMPVRTLKRTAAAAAAPEISEITTDSITVVPVEGCEYRYDGGIWQSDNVFTGLDDNTEYTVYQRFAETDTSYASESSIGTKVKTKKQVSENDPQIVFENKNGYAGGTVDVKITLKNNPGIASMKLIVTYGEYLTLTKINYGDMEGNSQQPPKMNSPVILNWFNGEENATGDFVYAVLTFAVSEDAPAGVVNSITAEYDPEDVYNITEQNVEFAVISGSVNITAYKPGDINGDKNVNNKDLTRLFQYLSQYDVEVVEAALDVNGDGAVNNKDLIQLFRYLSGWEVEIH